MIFQRLLLARPVAVEHYINYLRMRSQFETLENILAMLGRFEEAAVSDCIQCVTIDRYEYVFLQCTPCTVQDVHMYIDCA